MKLIKILLIFTLGIFSHISYACAPSASPFLEAPENYIDISDIPTLKTGFYPGQKTTFELIINHYVKLYRETEKNDITYDKSARDQSKIEEPEYHTKYLEGAEKFNKQEYLEALKIFNELRNNNLSLKEKLTNLFKKNDSWVREASTYMIARTELSIAQNDWDGYNDPVTLVDQKMLQNANSSYEVYLKEYPQGLYSESARNIKRRILFLSGSQHELDQKLKVLMSEVFSKQPFAEHANNSNILEVIIEFENYFKGKIDISEDHPILILYELLNSNVTINADQTKQLKNREKEFVPYPGLFDYVHTLGLYKAKLYDELILSKPSDATSNNLLSLSTVLLRAHAEFLVGKRDEALVTLEKLLSFSQEDSIEIKIANIRLSNSEGLLLYKADSPLKIEKNLRAIAQFRLSDQELESGINSAEITGDKRLFLLEELERRYLLTKRFKDLTLLMNQDKSSKLFTPIQDVIAKLATDENDPRALIEVGEFIYQKYITPAKTFEGYIADNVYRHIITEIWHDHEEDFNKRTKGYAPPIDFFRTAVQVISQSGKPNEVEAKALHYIVQCTKPGENWSRCVWNDKEHHPDENAGKQAFQRLHRFYKQSSWTAKTPYYYD